MRALEEILHEQACGWRTEKLGSAYKEHGFPIILPNSPLIKISTCSQFLPSYKP